MQVRIPYSGWDFERISLYTHSCFVLRSPSGLELKGQLVRTSVPKAGAAAPAAATAAAAGRRFGVRLQGMRPSTRRNGIPVPAISAWTT